MSHLPPHLCPTHKKNWKMCGTPPALPTTKKISLKVCRKAAADASNMTQANSKKQNKGRG